MSHNQESIRLHVKYDTQKQNFIAVELILSEKKIQCNITSQANNAS